MGLFSRFIRRCIPGASGDVEDLRKAAEQGNAAAQSKLGGCYFQGKGVKQDLREAVQWFHKAAEQGVAVAQYNLGVCYDTGKGVEQDCHEAVKWFHMAAEQGHAGAQHNLGVFYAHGEGVAQNRDGGISSNREKTRWQKRIRLR